MAWWNRNVWVTSRQGLGERYRQFGGLGPGRTHTGAGRSRHHDSDLFGGLLGQFHRGLREGQAFFGLFGIGGKDDHPRERRRGKPRPGLFSSLAGAAGRGVRSSGRGVASLSRSGGRLLAKAGAASLRGGRAAARFAGKASRRGRRYAGALLGGPARSAISLLRRGASEFREGLRRVSSPLRRAGAATLGSSPVAAAARGARAAAGKLAGAARSVSRRVRSAAAAFGESAREFARPFGDVARGVRKRLRARRIFKGRPAGRAAAESGPELTSEEQGRPEDLRRAARRRRIGKPPGRPLADLPLSRGSRVSRGINIPRGEIPLSESPGEKPRGYGLSPEKDSAEKLRDVFGAKGPGETAAKGSQGVPKEARESLDTLKKILAQMERLVKATEHASAYAVHSMRTGG